MIPEQRREKIIEKLKEIDFYTIENLARELNVSRITIQRDLSLLGKSGQVIKVHGGVRYLNRANDYIETRFLVRLKNNYEKKVEIAKKALEFVNDQSTIFLDSSTTAYIFALELFKNRFVDLNIITNSPSILCEALKYQDLKIIFTGGELRKDFNMLGGKWVVDFINLVNIDFSFISAAGISDDKVITTSNRELAEILEAVFKKSKEVNLLVDSTKFLKSGMLNINPLQKCTRIITDGAVDKKVVSEINKIKVEIIY